MNSRIIAFVQNKILRWEMKQRVFAATLVASALILSACGGGGGNSQPAPTPPPAPAKSILIEAYGDSTVRGCEYLVGAPSGSACENANYALANPTAPQALQTLLQTKYGTNVTVSNLGVPGTTAANLQGGDVLPAFQQQMAQSKADIVMIRFGINDSRTPSEPVALFQTTEVELVRIAKAAGKTVILETASPVTDPSCAALPTYAAATRKAANIWSIPVVDLYAELSVIPTWHSLLTDGIHPDGTGYSTIARQEFPVVDQVVGAALAH